METLRQILRKASLGLDNGFLYLPKQSHWDLDSICIIIDPDSLDESLLDEENEPSVASQSNLTPTLDSATVEDIAKGVKIFGNPITDELLFEGFLYYYEHDAFLPEPGFIPLPNEEWESKVDRDFYDLLGEENSDVLCKDSGCSRGVVKGSVYCKIHHFEMIKNKTCPFID